MPILSDPARNRRLLCALRIGVEGLVFAVAACIALAACGHKAASTHEDGHIPPGETNTGACVDCPRAVGVLSSSGAYGALIQTSAHHTNVGSLGPLSVGAAGVQTGAGYVNIGGLEAAGQP